MRNILHQESIAMAPTPAGCFPHLSEGLVGKGWAALVERHLVWFVEEPSVASKISYCKAWGVWAFYCLEVVFQLKQMMVPFERKTFCFMSMTCKRPLFQNRIRLLKHFMEHLWFSRGPALSSQAPCSYCEPKTMRRHDNDIRFQCTTL